MGWERNGNARRSVVCATRIDLGLHKCCSCMEPIHQSSAAHRSCVSGRLYINVYSSTILHLYIRHNSLSTDYLTSKLLHVTTYA